ncbi:hypothetical protein BaRGS_00005152 [Batillaria attramentaria]|uniref:4-hydroxybenzoate polyprenyltransferase, mitochondrial n=1 Tax=Batillaria attramentaria TaxID=370345 RepID=A0ABD0LWW9_9CAEN
MFCRHLLLRTMLPSGAQRLLGLETASVSPLSSLSSQHSCSSDLYVSQRTLRRLCSPPVTQFSCLGLGVHHSLHTRTGIQVDFTSCHKQSKTIHVPANHTLSQELHTGSSNRCGRSSTTKRHPLLGTQCTLSDVQPTRFLAFSTKAILEASPPSFQPYLRLIRFDKPIGTMLLLWPCTWSIALAATPGHLPDARMLALFGAGAFFMRGAGCIINDMWDSDFDKKVERTKLRPLASGELTHFQALVFLASQLSISLGILLQLNTYSILLGAASMILVVLYPLAKRFTYWPQLMLGFTFNYGALLGWSAVRGACEWSVCLPLYAAGIMWTLIYDTIYAHQDKYDDMLIGVKSSALKLGDQTKPCLAVFSTVMISCLTATGVMCDQTWPYFAGVGLTAAHLAHQLYTVDLNNADECAAKFRANSKLGLVLFLSIVAANLLRKETPAGDDAQKTDTVTD